MTIEKEDWNGRIEKYRHAEAYSEPYQTFEMEGFVKQVNGEKLFRKSSTLDVWQSCEYASVTTNYMIDAETNKLSMSKKYQVSWILAWPILHVLIDKSSRHSLSVKLVFVLSKWCLWFTYLALNLFSHKVKWVFHKWICTCYRL